MARNYSPVRAPRGTVAHAARYTSPLRTACGRRMKGWVMCLSELLGCEECKRAIRTTVAPRRRRRRRRVS